MVRVAISQTGICSRACLHSHGWCQGPSEPELPSDVQEADRGFHTCVTFDLVQRIVFAERFPTARKVYPRAALMGWKGGDPEEPCQHLATAGSLAHPRVRHLPADRGWQPVPMLRLQLST